MHDTQSHTVKSRQVGRRLCRMRAVRLRRQGHLTRHVRRYLTEQFPVGRRVS